MKIDYKNQIPSFILTFALVFVVSEFVFPQTTYGQESPDDLVRCEITSSGADGQTTVTEDITREACLAQNNTPTFGGFITSRVLGRATGEPTDANPGVPDDGSSIWDWLIDLVLLIPGWLSAYIILPLATWLTGLSGLILNFVVKYTVVEMSANLAKAGTIDTAWGVIRDVANMGFIFILLYAAIQTILGIGSDVKKLIVKVIVVAILINFSLFFTKLVIDASNILALLFYDAIAPGSLEINATTGISNSLMQPLELQSINDVTSGFDGTNLVIIGIMGTLVSLIVAFVFFAISIMFVIRFVVLIFVLVLSPLAFIALILPALQDKAKRWKDALLGQAFFAPIYFMLTWVVIVATPGLLSDTTGGSMANALGGGIDISTGEVIAPELSSVGLLLNFIIMIALILASLIIAKEWANKAGPGVTGLTKWATGAAGGATLGVAGRFGRGTIGRAGQAMSESEWLKEKATTSRMARLGLAASRKTAGASFDMRGVGALSALEAGKAQKGGFAKDLKNKTEAEKKYAEEFKPSDLTVIRAEKELADAKKTGTPADIASAQSKLDKISGASEEVLRQRKIKEFRARGDSKKEARAKLDALEDTYLQEVNKLTAGGMTQEAAEDDARNRNVGWSAKAEKGLLNIRKEAYAKTIETQKVGKIPFSLTGRHLIFGPVKKEARLAANAIRKSIKEKKPAEKFAEEIEKQVRESGDEAVETPTAPPAAPPTTPAGGTTPTP